MRILVTGVLGQLGNDFLELLCKDTKHDVTGIDIDTLDLTDQSAVKEYLQNENFEVIIHCAAYTNVDEAERNRDLCFDVNVNGTKYLANYCVERNAILVYFSTDYVFNGKLDKSKAYAINSTIDPINYYGKTKYLGEEEVRRVSRHKIFRISWVFGINGKNFIKTMIRLSKKYNEINVVSDQVGAPTYTRDISSFVINTFDNVTFGTFHLTNRGVVTWDEYARYVFKVIRSKTKVNSVMSNQYNTLAKRPLNSRLNSESLNIFNYEMPTWHDAVNRFLKEIGEIE